MMTCRSDHAMNGFTKLFQSILTSSVWSEDNETRIVWITMLALADQNGSVSATQTWRLNVGETPECTHFDLP